MPAFKYEALDTKGKTVTGIAEGDLPRQVRGELRSQGLMPLSVEILASTPTKNASSKLFRFSFLWRKEISGTQLAIVTRQFSTLVRAGLPVEAALSALAAQTDHDRTRLVLASIRGKVREGMPLGRSMAAFPRTFPDIYLRLVDTGEQSGQLDGVLERLADYMESRQALKQKVALAMVYPALLTLVSIGIVTGLLVSVVPQVTRVFENTGQILPVSTRILMVTSTALRAYPLLWLMAALLLVIVPFLIMRSDRGRRPWHQLQLRLPVVGRVVRGLNASRLASTLGILSSSGVPLVNALESAAKLVSNLPMKNVVERAVREISKGRSLSAALGAAGLFPPILIHLIASGEASGNLETMLQKAADAQRRELESWVAALTALLEPVLIIAMGGVVLFIVLAILAPIVAMNQTIR